MSKSFKKTPIVKDWNTSTKYRKQQANRRVRRTKNVPNGKAYRRYTNPYDIYEDVSRYSIHDWRVAYESILKEFERGVFNHYRTPWTREDIERSYGIEDWMKCYLRK